jgi:Lrp/AsnC family leucine-responsive transcriptional regulator
MKGRQQNSVATLDTKDCEILSQLQSNARMSFAELGRQVRLSTPAVIERVRQLEDARIILGYHAQINPTTVGLPVAAMVRITIDGSRIRQFAELVQTIPEVLECHRVTGAESYIVQVAVRDTLHLEEVIDSMMPYVSTNTSLILASPVAWNTVTPSQALPSRLPNRQSKKRTS